MGNTGFFLYLLFVASWFLHLTARVPALGLIRFDLVLIVSILLIKVLHKEKGAKSRLKETETERALKLLVAYIVLSTPFVYWPGTVIHSGLENFIKAVVFYYFTVAFVDNERRLKKFMMVFLACQSFRIVEPVYLHLTKGYWGAAAGMSGWEMMDRLAGAPLDVINPNGLAFVTLTVIPFWYFFSRVSKLNTLLALILIPLSLYALALTGSRSGVLGLLVVFVGLILKSEKKVPLAVALVVVVLAGFSRLDGNFKDRYTSIVSSDTRNAATAEGRIEGMKGDFMVALRRPLFGHGLGSSREANANFRGIDQPSHNLFAEIAQELGFIGLFIFLRLIKAIITSFRENLKDYKNTVAENRYLLSLNHGMQVWLAMNIFFSMATYGLSSFEWYLFAGLSVVMTKMAPERLPVVAERTVVA